LKEFEPDQLKVIIQKFRNDNFWCSNFLSPCKLLKKNPDGVRYVDVFIEKSKAELRPATNDAVKNLRDNHIPDPDGIRAKSAIEQLKAKREAMYANMHVEKKV
jgi:hypothetical protein